MKRQSYNTNWAVGESKSSLVALITRTQTTQEPVTLPHDAMISTDRSPDYQTGGGCGFFKPENVEYTKTAFFPKEDEGKVIYLEFEGVYMNASVWVNGDFAGKHTYGYSNFYVKINDFINFGEENTIKVVVKNASQPNSRWYSGTGIYRNVKLMTGNPLHIKVDGVLISTPAVKPEIATVEVATEIENEGVGFKNGFVVTELIDADGNVAAEERTRFSIFSGESITVRQRIYVENPALWDLESPNLYTCKSRLEANGETIDEDCNTFGIRSLDLDPVNGMQINGKTIKLKGGCIHHDSGILGAATFEDAEYRRAKFHKAAGYNALRSAHHPMSKAMLDACDRIGILVMDEFSDAWTQAKCDFDYGFSFADFWEADTELMVKKDFNHPCVVLYSIGNEIPDIGQDRSAGWGRKIAEKIRSLDKTRYITNGLNLMLAVMGSLPRIMKSMGMSAEEGKGSGEINQLMTNMQAVMGKLMQSSEINRYVEESCGILDVIGYNYSAERYENEPDISKNHIVVGAETFPKDLDKNWELVTKHGHVLGDFSWTSWDYLGEAGIGHIGYEDDMKASIYGDYPWIAAYCADFDLTGYRRPVSYWREIVWGGRGHVPYIAVQRPERYGQQSRPGNWSWTDSVSSWTWPGSEGKNAIVEVYSDAEEVELFIAGISQGRKPVGDDFKKCYCKFDAVYRPGEVLTVAYINGEEIGRFSLKTAGAPMLKVSKECDTLWAGSNDLCYLNIELVDENGNLNTAANRAVTVTIDGPATLQASGSADPKTEENYRENTHETFYGRMLAVVRAGAETGTSRLTVSAEGMADVSVDIAVV